MFVDAFIRGKSSQSASQKDRDLASVLLILHGSAVQVHQNVAPNKNDRKMAPLCYVNWPLFTRSMV